MIGENFMRKVFLDHFLQPLTFFKGKSKKYQKKRSFLREKSSFLPFFWAIFWVDFPKKGFRHAYGIENQVPG